MAESQTGQATLEELKRDALKHYDEVSTKAHHWNSLVPRAIETYTEWISVNEKRPLLVPGMNCSQNVLAVCEGRLMVMCYSYIEAGEDSGYAWCNCYGDINGDAEYDDDYKVTHWQPLPSPPKELIP